MAKQRKYPLIIWEGTLEFKKECEEALERFNAIKKNLYGSGFRSTSLSTLRFDSDGYPEVWLNASRLSISGYSSRDYRMPPTAEEAIKAAKIGGDTGWWSLDDLEQLLEGRGRIFERAMRNMGYRIHKKHPEQWVKFSSTREYDAAQRELVNQLQGEREKKWAPVHDAKELERLRNLWIVPNTIAPENTIAVEVGKRGMIHMELNYILTGYSSEQLECLGWQESAKAHIIQQQEGFFLDAKNIRLGEEKSVYIKATREGDCFIERVWPWQVARDRVYDLAEDLVSRAVYKNP